MISFIYLVQLLFFFLPEAEYVETWAFRCESCCSFQFLPLLCFLFGARTRFCRFHSYFHISYPNFICFVFFTSFVWQVFLNVLWIEKLCKSNATSIICIFSIFKNNSSGKISTFEEKNKMLYSKRMWSPVLLKIQKSMLLIFVAYRTSIDIEYV